MSTNESDKTETFISVDVEADGPCPGMSSMLSLGAVACDQDGYLFRNNTDFSKNLETLPGANPHKKTMEEFWEKFPEAWAKTQVDKRPILEVVSQFCSWVQALPGAMKTIIVNPSCFDSTYLYYYLCYVYGESPAHIGFRMLDVHSYVSGVMATPFPQSARKDWPTLFLSKLPHTHVAIEDAYEQLDSWLRIYSSNLYGYQHPRTINMRLKGPRVLVVKD